MRLFESRRASFPNPIPKGLRIKAQGCEERATLGKCREQNSTPTGLWQCAMAGYHQAAVAVIKASVDPTAPSQPWGWTRQSLALKILIMFKRRPRYGFSVLGAHNPESREGRPENSPGQAKRS